MRLQQALLIALVLVGSVSCAGAGYLPAPAWATPVPGEKHEVHEPARRITVPGSNLALTRSAIDDRYNAPEWFPDTHAPMPAIVRHGNRADVWACAMCHLASGGGHPQSARLAGLSVPYFLSQLQNFKQQRRLSYAGPLIDNLHVPDNDTQARQAAEWFAGLPVPVLHRVVETDTVPRSRFVNFMRLVKRDRGGSVVTEPIAGRIIEIPEDEAAVVARDPRALMISHVPPGSIARGREVAAGRKAGLAACNSCHGTDLRGAPAAPPLAGLFGTYIVRQLYDFKNDRRIDAGGYMNVMSKQLPAEDIVSVAAYLGSLSP